MIEIKIKGKKYKWGFDSVWGPTYAYEMVCGDKLPFDARKVLCLHVMWWCILMQSNEGCDVSLDEWMKAMNDVELAKRLGEEYAKRMQALMDGATSENFFDGSDGDDGLNGRPSGGDKKKG